MEDEYGDNIILPFFLNCVTYHLNVDTLTRDEFESHECPRIILTHRDLTWDPSTTIYEDQKNSMLNYKGDIVWPDVTARGPFMVVNSVCIPTGEDAADISSVETIANVLQSNVNISHVNVMKPNNVSQVSYADSTLNNIQLRKRKKVDSETLVKRWNIDRKKALKNVKRTTQRSIRTCIFPYLSRIYPTNDCMMRYNFLPHSVFLYIMKSFVVSKRGNKYGQAYFPQ